ncbi:MAG: hypothetical protein WBV85_06330 [Solirubrobacteraceae bacterium]
MVAEGGRAGIPQVGEGAHPSNFAFQPSLPGLFSLDGFQWLLNGNPIAGQRSDSFSPSNAEIGETISCGEPSATPLQTLPPSAGAERRSCCWPRRSIGEGSNRLIVTHGRTRQRQTITID